MAWTVLALWVVFLSLCFGVKSVALWRRTGTTGYRGFSRTGPAAVRLGGVLFVVALLAGVSSPVLVLAGLVDAWVVGQLVVVGWSLAVVGLSGTLVSQFAMGDSWRVGVDPAERTELATGGPFGLVRNPIFSAMLIATAGLALMLPTWLAVCGWLALLFAVQLQVRLVEEPYLNRVHGSRYAAYAARVGRFVPGLGRASSESLRA